MMSSWFTFLPAGLMTLGAVVTYLAGTPQPTPLARPLGQTIPAMFEGAVAKNAPIEAEEVRASGVSDYLNWDYDLGGVQPVSLYIGYHATQQGDKRMHSPTLCLPGSGWTPNDARLVPVAAEGHTYTVNRYMLQKGPYQILVYYWFQGRGRVTAGEGTLKLNAFKDALVSHRDEEALVRIVVPMGTARGSAPIGTSGLVPDSVASRLAAVTIPAVTRALPLAP